MPRSLPQQRMVEAAGCARRQSVMPTPSPSCRICRSRRRRAPITGLRGNEPHAASPAFRIPDPPAADAPIQSRGQLVAARLEAGLTPEMMKNFDLFLYVSKADTGPLSQRMYVFEKQRSGELKLLYDWAASTGRERREISPRGAHTVTDHASRLLSA